MAQNVQTPTAHSLPKILILSHGNSMSGAVDRFEDYLRRRHQTLKLQHPLDDYKALPSKLTQGKTEIRTYRRKNIPILNYFIDITMNLREISKNKPEIVVGANNLDTYAALIGRILFRWRKYKIIFFASDYSEGRFKQPLLDGLYQMIERYDDRHSDMVISNTKRAESKRKQLGLTSERSIVIPNGVYLADPDFSSKTIDKRAFLYVGSINPEHGLVSFVETYAKGIGSLDVIGEGRGLEELSRICAAHNIKLKTHGSQPQRFVQQFMKQFSGLGLAPYTSAESYVYFGSSMKISEYLAHGIPVITSTITEQAENIRNDNLGVVYEELTFDEISNKIKAFNTNEFHIKAERFYAENNIDKLYSQVPLTEIGLTK